MKATHLTAYFLFLLITVKIVSAQPGTLDPSFGVGGVVNLNPFFAIERAKDIAVTTDGKILLLASSGQTGNWLLKLNADGTLDTSFGDQGKFYTDDNSYGSFIDAAIEVDQENRILVYTRDAYWYVMYVTRLLPDGSVDLSFGNDGYASTPFSWGNRALCLQSDGKIVVGGYRDELYYSSANIVRLDSNGTYDATFNGNGMNSIPVFESSYIFAIGEQPDGKLLATGNGDSSMFVARFNANGQLDSTFDSDGLTIFNGDGVMAGQGVVVTADGNILVVGHSETTEESSLLCWMLLSDGTIDSSFGNNGVATLYTGGRNNFGWFAFANADSTSIVGGTVFDGAHYFPVLYHLNYDGSIDSSYGVNGIAGKTFLCGESIQLNGARTTDGKILFSGTGFDNGNNYVSVSQLHSDGSVDSSFANNGVATLTTVGNVNSSGEPGDYLVLNDGKIFFAGFVHNQNYDLVFFRLNADGTLDSTYGVGGYYLPNQQVGTYEGFIVSDSNSIYFLQNVFQNKLGDEDLVFPAVYYNAGEILHKFHSDGTPDSSFGVNGMLTLSFPNFQLEGCTDLAIQADGKLLVAGYETQNVNYNYVFIERLNADGSIDSTFGDNGMKIFDAHDQEYHLFVAIRSDNKIDCAFSYPLNGQYYVAVSRLLPDGSFDSTFATNGSESIVTNFWALRQFILQADNKMLFQLNGNSLSILRINEDGSIDSAFGNNGFLDNEGWGMQLQSDQKILTWNATGGAAITRYKNDGDTDLTFGTNGVATLTGQFNDGGSYSLRLQPDGKILFANSIYPNFYVARLLNDIGLSANESISSSTFNVYPNPASDQLIIGNPVSINERVTISITGPEGKRMKQETENFNGNQFTISVKDLPSGIYLLTVRTENNSVTLKFVKQ